MFYISITHDVERLTVRTEFQSRIYLSGKSELIIKSEGSKLVRIAGLMFPDKDKLMNKTVVNSSKGYTFMDMCILCFTL